MRIKKIQKYLKDSNIDQIIISNPVSINYFIGKQFQPGERLLVLLVSQNGKPKLLLNELFPYESEEIVDVIRFHDTEDSIKLLAAHLVGASIGVDHDWSSGFLLELMNIEQEKKFMNASNLINQCRNIKDESEIELMRRSSEINDLAMKEVSKLLRKGVKEIEVFNQLNDIFMKIDPEARSYGGIVAFKENAADPHGVSGERILDEGDSIVIDIGCIYRGYYSDMTRTFFLKENSMRKVYDTVLQANLNAISVIKPGVKFCDIDKAARLVIEEAGYGEYFTHRTGHGIGMEIHEPLDVNGTNNTIVEEGMCFSIEPGIYLPKVGGVRIEDLVIVTRDGCEILNHYPKTAEIIKENFKKILLLKH